MRERFRDTRGVQIKCCDSADESRDLYAKSCSARYAFKVCTFESDAANALLHLIGEPQGLGRFVAESNSYSLGSASDAYV